MLPKVIALFTATLLAGCATAAPQAPAASPTHESDAAAASKTPAQTTLVMASGGDAAQGPASDAPRENASWIGAAPASDFILRSQRETLLGVWVDVPTAAKIARAKSALALVIDTSGSMSGPKIQHARAAAHRMVDSLPDGDIVSIQAFSDTAEDRIAPFPLDPETRRTMHAVIDHLSAAGGTNLFDGLRLAELRVASAPSSHPVRRVVVISDGVATVGPTSPELLGAIAETGAERGIQVTALGVGLDYDERTLNTLAVRSSGRMHHLASPEDMANVLAEETRLFAGTRATDAVVEIVPAPGVTILSVAGARATPVAGGGMRVPLGAMFGGQHREMAVRVRVDDAESTLGASDRLRRPAPQTPTASGARPLASVRLHFRDPAEQGLPRVQEVVARFDLTDDPAVVARTENARARTIAAVHEAAEISIAAAQDVNAGRFEDASKALAQAEQRLNAVAATVRDEKEKQRVLAAARNVSAARQSAGSAAAAPPAPAARRARALEINAAAMHDAGF
ncbi:VWA domain-containing protein [Polyangium sp. y55x31]|uniref:vWA domain-containing protein n=1 Tax=Polyangium sp. y55x31 TaxID=3042688 RepID=UPI00248233C3|nr:VWA domain-containing protein [Polyangium sp. y55x31]MDI1483930.1 VWA domain-containing protein [Polyangium sp. y55x31]